MERWSEVERWSRFGGAARWLSFLSYDRMFCMCLNAALLFVGIVLCIRLVCVFLLDCTLYSGPPSGSVPKTEGLLGGLYEILDFDFVLANWQVATRNR